MRRMHTIAGLVAFAGVATVLATPTLNVGSKRFTESYILGEILTQTAQSAGDRDRAFTDLHALLSDAILIAPMAGQTAIELASGHQPADPSVATPAAAQQH